MVNENNRNAFAGQNVETLFKNTIKGHPSIIEKIRQKYKIEGRFLTAMAGGIHGEKVDVRLGFAGGHNIEANVKAYKGSGFNQLTRTSVKKFCEDFGLDSAKREDLENIVIEKSKHTTQPLFTEEAIARWEDFFRNNAKKIIHWGFSRTPAREILVIYSRDRNIMQIYSMRDVLDRLSPDVVFTRGGFNIGDCISFQRKGGNGSLSHKHPQTSIQHPGNNIQLKLKTSRFVAEMESIKFAEYSI